jgi:hypothetical protein
VKIALLGLLVALTACNKGLQNKDAVRQGVLDYLSQRTDLSMSGMTVDVTNVTFRDGKADADVSFTAKGGPASGGMTMRYTLEQKDNKWVVVGKADSGRGPHGGAAMPPDMANPHGGMGGGVDTERPGGGASGSGGMPPGHPAVGQQPGSEKK